MIPAILFLLTQQNTLKAIRVENRLMRPGLVWLQLIPIFGQIWQFIVVTRIAGSIRKEMASRQDDSILGVFDANAVQELNKRPTFTIGITYGVLFNTIFIMNLYLSIVGQVMLNTVALLFLSGTICWIIYWIRLAQYKNRLKRLDI